MPGIIDLIERINQGVLALWFERNAQVNGRAGRGVTLTLPLFRNGIPLNASASCRPYAAS